MTVLSYRLCPQCIPCSCLDMYAPHHLVILYLGFEVRYLEVGTVRQTKHAMYMRPVIYSALRGCVLGVVAHFGIALAILAEKALAHHSERALHLLSSLHLKVR